MTKERLNVELSDESDYNHHSRVYNDSIQFMNRCLEVVLSEQSQMAYLSPAYSYRDTEEMSVPDRKFLLNDFLSLRRQEAEANQQQGAS